MRSLPAALSAFLLCLSTLPAQQLTVVGYNAESGDADPTVVGQRLAELDGVDVWGMVEVLDDGWATIFEASAEMGENANFSHVLGTTGSADRMAILYDADRFDLVGTEELHGINIGDHVRAPLIAHLRFKDGGQEFLFMVNHLYRSKADRRHLQAELLNEWAAQQTLPVIAVGDYNFDWDIEDGDEDHDEGYEILTAGDTFKWLRPEVLVSTQGNPAYNSVLDFVFTAGQAQLWGVDSTIIVTLGDFPDDGLKSDHRPVMARFDLDAGSRDAVKEEILARIAAMEAELVDLRRLVEGL